MAAYRIKLSNTASRPEVMCRVLGIVYRSIATHLIKQAGFSQETAQAGAVALIQHLGSALTKSPGAILSPCTPAWRRERISARRNRLRIVVHILYIFVDVSPAPDKNAQPLSCLHRKHETCLKPIRARIGRCLTSWAVGPINHK